MSVAVMERAPSNVFDVGTRVDGESIRVRRTALGLTAKALAERAGVDRSRVAAAEAGGPVRPSTMGALDAALTQLEAEVSGPYDAPDHITNVIEMPDGTKVTFVGSPENVVEAAQRFLKRRKV